MQEEVLGAESGLGLLRDQDSGRIRGRLNLLGNGDSVDAETHFPYSLEDGALGNCGCWQGVGLGLEAPGQEAAGGGWGLGFPAVRWRYQRHTPPRSAPGLPGDTGTKAACLLPSSSVVIVTLTSGRAPGCAEEDERGSRRPFPTETPLASCPWGVLCPGPPFSLQ